jgi:hypothetical protein
MIEREALKNSIALPLKKAGFVKKGLSWWIDSKDIIVVVNLQKCDWGDYYFINIGFWLKALEKGLFPKEHECHLSYRAESLFPEQRELILVSCHLEMSDPELLADLSTFIESPLIPFLIECTQESKLKELLAQGVLNNGLVWIEARKYLTGGNPK